MRAIAYGTGAGSILGHRLGGYPQFDGWPRWDSITHQAVFEDWLARAVEGGLRLMVMLAVNNEYLCGLANRFPGRTCNDMEAVDLQLQAAKDFEAYLDDRSGGAGRGWYRIVRTPAEARAVIAQGRLAVILGIEVDYLFNCRAEGDLSEAQLNQELDRYFDLGVRFVFPIHFSNNGFGGTAFQNALIRSAGGGPVSETNPVGTIGAYEIQTEDAQVLGYAYRTGRRNVLGLTDLGKILIRGLIERGMVIDIDHMSAYAKADTLDICEELACPVVSGHTGFIDISLGDKRHEGQLTSAEVGRIRNLGGMVNPIVRRGTLTEIRAADAVIPLPHVCGASSNSFAQAYLYTINRMAGAPTGFGTDFNGFAGLPGPRFGPEACPGGRGPGDNPPEVSYPFTVAATGAVMDRSVVGDKTFDFNTEGLAHVGMLPDLIADLEAQGITGDLLDPLLNSAHARPMRRPGKCRSFSPEREELSGPRAGPRLVAVVNETQRSAAFAIPDRVSETDVYETPICARDAIVPLPHLSSGRRKINSPNDPAATPPPTDPWTRDRGAIRPLGPHQRSAVHQLKAQV